MVTSVQQTRRSPVMLHRPGARGTGHPLLKLASPRLKPLETGGVRRSRVSRCSVGVPEGRPRENGLFCEPESARQNRAESSDLDLTLPMGSSKKKEKGLRAKVGAPPAKPTPTTGGGGYPPLSMPEVLEKMSRVMTL